MDAKQTGDFLQQLIYYSGQSTGTLMMAALGFGYAFYKVLCSVRDELQLNNKLLGRQINLKRQEMGLSSVTDDDGE